MIAPFGEKVNPWTFQLDRILTGGTSTLIPFLIKKYVRFWYFLKEKFFYGCYEVKTMILVGDMISVEYKIGRLCDVGQWPKWVFPKNKWEGGRDDGNEIWM